MQEILREQGLDGEQLIPRAKHYDIVHRYRQSTDKAVAAGVFGSPSYVYRGELFWGQDRLDMLEEYIASA